ncbi:hypothetical protein JTE90_009965 [Oedothorax gibbosus]|uniref:Mpv17-like protein 2 n=1 Tax=Oedothorax gibbosus TaxID=931172 RepID=A0AAV6V8C4_9ARAC|nr:hypothetical protein JTE90_009965 [Oedothorax gibbosus]
MRLFGRVQKFVDRLFSKHLLVTNTTLGIFFLGAGDVIQQNVEKRFYHEKEYEKKRTGNMMLSGSVFGFAGHYWYRFLDTRFPGTSKKQVGKKIFLEMLIGPPIVFGFFMANGYLEGKSPKTSFEEFKKNFVVVCAADWLVYAPLQALNFFYVPVQFRFLYVCGLCLAYDVFLSYILHKEDNEKLALKKTE